MAHLIDCILDPAKSAITGGDQARQVIEIMSTYYGAARRGRTLDLEITFDRTGTVR